MTFYKILSYPERDAVLIRNGCFLELLFEYDGNVIKAVRKTRSAEEAIRLFEQVDESDYGFHQQMLSIISNMDRMKRRSKA